MASRSPDSDSGFCICPQYKYKRIGIVRGTLDIDISGNTLWEPF